MSPERKKRRWRAAAAGTISARSRTRSCSTCCRSCSRRRWCARACSPGAGTTSGSPCPSCASPAPRRHTSSWTISCSSATDRPWKLACSPSVYTPRTTRHSRTSGFVSGFLTTLELGGMIVGKFLDFSSCPALEELKITKCTISADKISSPSLKHLSICECKFKSNGRTVISVPSLLLLQLIALKGRTPFLEDMPLLLTAKVILSGYYCRDYCHSNDPGYCPIGCMHCYGVDDGSTGCVLLNGLADATNLELIADPKVFILRRDLRWCPTFTKLKTLLLIQWVESADYCALICILQHSPFLEKLTLQLSKKPDIDVRSRAIYNSMGKSFASENLKTVEVKCQDIDQKVHKLIISLNNYRIPLEKINIQQTNESYECT